CQQYYLAPFTF
nr:immunoglobulin light chain junction region [Macaca mulatta]MOV74852.1 immunoglobulin light chain junction region [Macaca mulatta]MOX89775.1 immunoglobulin light chain junction region [Macaca mulatta]